MRSKITAIHKFLICLLTAALLFCLTAGGCAQRLSFVEGEYASIDEVADAAFSKVKLELYNIDKQRYSKANGVNVICDVTKSGDEKYFSFDLYLYVDKLNEYRKVNVNELEYVGGSPQVYKSYPSDGNGYIVSGTSYKIDGIVFEYQSIVTVTVCQNETEYYCYRISL